MITCISCTNSWLQPGKVNQALGPDCDDSPHSIRVSPLDLGIAPHLALLFGPQKADQDHPNKKVKQEGSQAPDANQAQDKVPSPEEVLVTLRVQVDSCRPADLTALTTILLGGTPASGYKLSKITLMMCPFLFPVASCYSWFVRLLPRWGMMYIWSTQADVTNRVTLCRGTTPFPSSGVHVSIRAERYLAALPTLKQGVIAGVFKNKGAAPWAITRAEKLQLSVFLPNDLSLDDWYAGVYALPTVWPDVTMLGANNLRRVVGFDFHHLRKKYDVLSMWGNIHPQWRLLQQHLETKGPGWYPLSEREERLFTNRSNRPGDDMKDELRTDGDPIAWRAWSTAQNQLWQLRQPAPALEFPGEQGMFIDMHAQVREEEQVISPQFTRSQQDVSMRKRKKSKQVDDGTAIG